MRIIEIAQQDNGSHRNQSGDLKIIPEGWAVIPDNMETKNFPFGEVEIEEIDGIMTVTKWITGEIPETKELEKSITETEQLRADVDYIAVMTGVEL